MSEFQHIDTKRLYRDFNNLRVDWKRGVEESKLTKKYKYLRDLSESLFRVATREEQANDKILLKKLVSVIENRQTGRMTKREAEESFGSSLGDVFVQPVKKILEDKKEIKNETSEE